MKRFFSGLRNLIIPIILSSLLAFILTEYILINAHIPSASMVPTIQIEDRLFGNRLAYGINLSIGDFKIVKKFKEPERNDIVIFHYPDDERLLYIKRLIGLPGECIEIKNGNVYINGKINRSVNEHINEPMLGNFGPVYIPEDCYFMMGDNRNNSHDSRFWENKFVHFKQILGKAFIQYFPEIKFI